jgi:hypothetical protein
LTATLNASKSGTAITGGGRWLQKMISSGKKENLKIFKYIFIVLNLERAISSN